MPIGTLNQLRGLSASDRTDEERQVINEQMGYSDSVYEDRIKDAFTLKYKDDQDFQELSTGLDTRGMSDLLKSDYYGSNVRNKKYEDTVNSLKQAAERGRKALDNPFTAMGAASTLVGSFMGQVGAVSGLEDNEKHDREIREKLFAETQERRERSSRKVANAVYDSFVQSDKDGVKSLSDTYKEFDNFANNKEVSPHYAAFRNSKWLKDYSQNDRLKDYAMYQALASQYGEGMARQYLDRTIQNRVAEAQDGKWTGNTGKKILSTIVSDLGSNIGMMSYIGKSTEEIGLLNQGLDPNKPFYDEQGNIIGYEPIESIWANPSYWSDVYKYNTIDPEEIKIIKERGGISDNVNIREYGHIPSFLSWETLQEAGAQSGHIVAFGIESGLTGALGKSIGLAGKSTLKALGVSEKALSKMSKVGNITNDLFVTFSSGSSAAQQEAMGEYDNELQKHREKIEEQKRHELHEYYQTIDYTTPEAKEAIAGYYSQLKRQDNRRVAQQVEGVEQIPQSDDALVEKAKQLYANDLLQAKSIELNELHKPDEIEASKAAATGYGTTFLMDWIKEAPFNLLVQKFKFAKGSLSGALDNTVSKSIVGDLEMGGIKRAGKNLASAKNVAKESGKLIGGGFADEWLDGVNASFAEGVSNNEFNNYINRTYNPEVYSETVDNILGNVLSGMVSGIQGTLDRQNLYEGSIGAISPLASGMVNVNVAFHPKDTWKAVVRGMDSNGAKLNAAERMSALFMNPLLNTYAQLKADDRTIDNTVEVVNDIIAKKKDNLQSASEILYGLHKYNDPLSVVNYVNEDTEDSNSFVPSMLDSKDDKLHNAFTLINTLDALSSIPEAEKSPIYQQALQTINGLAEGSLSGADMEEEIDDFLADPDNKSILDLPNNREVAADRLKENAQYFTKIRENMQNVSKLFAESPSMKNVDPRVKTILTYGIVASDDYKARLKEIEDGLGISSTQTDALYVPDFNARYGTLKARETALAARERMLSDNQKQQSKIQEQIDKNEAAKTKLEGKSKNAEVQDDLNKLEALINSQKFQLNTLKEKQQTLVEEKNALAEAVKTDTETQFTEDLLLGLDARDRAEVLNPNNKNNYSKQQQKVIEHVRKKLIKENPEALSQIRDAGILANRISDLQTMHEKLINNDELAATYLNAVEQARTEAAMAESIQRGIEAHYDKIEKAYAKAFNPRARNKSKWTQEFKEAIMNTSSKVIEAYMEDHPEQAEYVQPYYDMLKFTEDAAVVIANSNVLPDNKLEQLNTLLNIVKTSNTKNEVIAALEKVVDDTDGTSAAEDFESILSGLEQLGYKRDNTVVETRKQRREREAAQKKVEEEAKKKLEEERKAAVEKATREAERKKREEGEKKDELNKAQQNKSEQSEEAEEIKPNAEFTEGEKGTLDLGEGQQNKENPVINNMGQIVDDGQGNVMAVSPTLEEQAREDKSGEESVLSSEETLEDPEATNTNVGDSNETRDNTFSGYAMNTYHIVPNEQQGISEEDSLKYGGKLTRKKGEDNPKSDYVTLPDGTKLDKRNRFNRWMEQTMGINLENIVSRELNQIIAANPDLKVKFLTVRGRNLKTETDELDDNAMRSHLLLVVDYDNNVNKNIESIHSNENGGVLESNGKKYLVVGVVGYGNGQNRVRQELYDNLYSNLKAKENDAVLRQESQQFFKENPKERFYVSPNFTTEMVPMSLTPGWIVKRLENDETTSNRKVSELLFDVEGNPNKERNPEGLTWKDLSWGIQKGTGFLPINGRKYSKWAVMKPQKDIENLGNTFLLIPAGNGKLVPSYIIPTNYTDLQDGALKNRITDIIMKMTAPISEGQQAYIERLNALRELSRIFHFSKDGNNILLSKDGSTLTFVKGAEGSNSVLQAGTIRFTDSDARDRFFELFNTLNPRVNITADVLMDTDKLKEYDEAGALRTDAALLHTAGSGYSVWAVDRNGVMLKPASVDNPAWREANDRNTNKKNVFYSGERYLYNRDNGTFYDASGNVITDENLIEELNYNRQIADGELTSDYTRGEWNYYLLEEGEHPKAIKVHSSTKKITKATEEEARNLAERIKTQKEDAARKQAAEARKDLAQTLPEVNLGMDAQTGDVMAQDVWKKEQPVEEKSSEDKPQKPSDVTTLVNAYKATSPAQNFETMFKSRELMGRNEALGLDNRGLMGLISDTFADSPVKFDDKGRMTNKNKKIKSSELSDFLKGKNIEVDAIGTSTEDMKAWIETIKNCR